ncbi:MAG TPA: hypothetical protein DEQ84_04460 [Prevotellaceae bacterium]|nr:hypothetical protein [Prevotellaceae bacterium]
MYDSATLNLYSANFLFGSAIIQQVCNFRIGGYFQRCRIRFPAEAKTRYDLAMLSQQQKRCVQVFFV